MKTGIQAKFVSTSARSRDRKLTHLGHKRIAHDINEILEVTVRAFTNAAVDNFTIDTGMAAAELVPLADQVGAGVQLRGRIAERRKTKGELKKKRYLGGGFPFRHMSFGEAIGESSFQYSEMQGGDLRRTGASFSFNTQMAHFQLASGDLAIEVAQGEADIIFEMRTSRYLMVLEKRYGDDIPF